MIIASDFVPPPRREFPAWVRYASRAAVYGIGVPVAKTIELAGWWPSLIARRVGRELADPFGGYRPSGHDVFVCSGFKSGTTWMLQIATQIAFRGEAEFDDIHSVVPWPDAPPLLAKRLIPLANDSPIRRSPTRLRVIKTHLPQDRVPYSPDARYIALVRDPKDVIVSSHRFLRSLVYGPMMPSVSRWVDINLSVRSHHVSWHRHLASYWRVRDRENVLFLTYEALAGDPRATVAGIARFMRVRLSPTQLERIVHASSFARMRELRSKFDPGRVVPWGGDDSMLRRGRTGAAREVLSVETRQRIDRHYRDELQRLGCDFPYDEAFVAA